ncbi:hypothetical protein A2U01_0098232, partial [Trifolium medium]|nr:hypothetical protein [Trifolium medium]
SLYRAGLMVRYTEQKYQLAILSRSVSAWHIRAGVLARGISEQEWIWASSWPSPEQDDITNTIKVEDIFKVK